MKTLKLLGLAALFAACVTICHAQTTTATPVVAAPAFTLTSAIEALVTVSTLIAGAVMKSKLSTSQKVVVAIVKGVEYATSLPEVKALEGNVKAIITTHATELGVQDDLDKIVQNVTSK